MQINVEDMLQELLRFDRKTNDKVKVDRMTRVVAHTILAMESAQFTCEVLQNLMSAEPGGHA